MVENRVRLHAANRVRVDAYLSDAGELVLRGQDLNGAEYEYAITVAAGDVPAVVAALGAPEGTPVLPLLAEHGSAIVHKGELTWLKGLGLTVGFWSRRDD